MVPSSSPARSGVLPLRSSHRAAGVPFPEEPHAPGGGPPDGPGSARARSGEVVVLTADPALAEQLVRCATEVGVRSAVVAAPSAVGPAWADGALVLLGADCVPQLSPRATMPSGGLVVVLDDEGELPVDLLPEVSPARAGAPSTGHRPGAGATAASVPGLPAGLTHAELVVLPSGRNQLLDRLATVLPAAHAPVLGVVGGRGGAGASTLAVSTALAAAGAGLRVALLDLDPLGGGVDLLLGADHQDGLRWSDLGALPARLPHGSLWAALPEAAGVGYLTWDREEAPTGPAGSSAAPPGLPPVLPSVLDAARREVDLVVLDLPRCPHTLASAATLASRVVVLVPAEVRGAASARRVVAVLEPVVADLQLVVRGPAPTGLPAEEVADVLGVPLAGEVRSEPGLAAALDRGDLPTHRGRGPLALLCRRLVADLLAAQVAQVAQVAR